MLIDPGRNRTNNFISGRDRRGFTLIELLVVIAIIAILAAILFPVFSRARENGRRSSCMSNLKEIGLATMQYTQEFDEKMPRAILTAGQTGAWMYAISIAPYGGGTVTTYGNTASAYDPSKGSIYAYAKNAQIFVCPSDSAKQGDSYAMNQLADGKKLPLFANTASTILFGEEADNGKGSTDDASILPGSNPLTKRHLNTSVVAFVDGHVKTLTTQVTYPQQNTTDPRYEP